MNETDVSLYSSLRALRQGHAAWRLLAADQAAFIVSFFEREFLRPGRRAIPEAELLRDLEAYLGEVQQAAGESLLRPARAYLLAWADAEHGWLTRFHGADDVPCYDLTAAAEQAVGFVRSLTREEVLGTESRLRTVVSLLDEIAEDRDEDAGRREQRLLARRAEIDAELSELRRTGKVRPRLTAGQVRERYQQARETAAGIVRDFRALEEEFSALERGLMQEVVTWQEGKGELLRRVFAQGDVIRESPQGRSFALFWQFLMQPEEQASLARLLEEVARVPELKDLAAVDGARLEDLASAAPLCGRAVPHAGARDLPPHPVPRGRGDGGARGAAAGRVPRHRSAARGGQSAARPQALPAAVPPAPARPCACGRRAGGGGGARQGGAWSRALAAACRPQAVTLTEVLARHPLTQGLSELLAYFVLAGHQAGAVQRTAVPLASVAYEQAGHRLRARCEEVVFYPAEEKGGKQ